MESSIRISNSNYLDKNDANLSKSKSKQNVNINSKNNNKKLLPMININQKYSRELALIEPEPRNKSIS